MQINKVGFRWIVLMGSIIPIILFGGAMYLPVITDWLKLWGPLFLAGVLAVYAYTKGLKITSLVALTVIILSAVFMVFVALMAGMGGGIHPLKKEVVINLEEVRWKKALHGNVLSLVLFFGMWIPILVRLQSI
ncbi:hypothetical protein [Gracilibacillus timonensis]|uniref:hypothetical protein n=1 Tax=Gracilibacillus timonensis TaxID=1816696 RepID=UPI0008248E81|nr:hypothetical protein [Gracilibacillus timonensis]